MIIVSIGLMLFEAIERFYGWIRVNAYVSLLFVFSVYNHERSAAAAATLSTGSIL